MGRSTTSLRLDDDLRRRLSALAEGEGTSLTSVVERLLREGLAVAEHPGIVFKPGPAGRRASLAGGPDVWEIAAALLHTSGTEAERVKQLAQEFGLQDRQVVIALSYAASNRPEIEACIRANEFALEEAKRIAGERKRLMA